jgi:pimeloyl-ACP methyl ester carboxylesterase
MLGDDRVWGDVAAELSDVAQPSFPRIDQHDTIASMAAAVLTEAPERFALAGHSLGGIVALELLRQSPERVTRLALVNTSGRDASATQLESWATMVTRTKAGEFGEVAAELGHATLPEAHRGAELAARNTAMAETVGADGFLRQLAAQATRPDSRPTLQGVGVPTLVVTGALDHVCPPALQQELAGAIRGSRHVVIADAGHMSPLETPHEVAQALRVWLAH